MLEGDHGWSPSQDTFLIPGAADPVVTYRNHIGKDTIDKLLASPHDCEVSNAQKDGSSGSGESSIDEI